MLTDCLIVLLLSLLFVTSSVIRIDIANYYCLSISVAFEDTVPSLYSKIVENIPSIISTHKISIIFRERLILNLVNDRRTVSDIGIRTTSNSIQIIQKPDFAALLEMISDIRNKENIPWFDRAGLCVSDPSSISSSECRNVSRFGKRLDCDDRGRLIGIDISFLNLTGRIHLESLPESVRSLDISFNALNTGNLQGLRDKSLEKLNVEHNRRYHINTEFWDPRLGNHFPVNVLQISSNQITPWITDRASKLDYIRNWMLHQRILKEVIVDGQPVSRNHQASKLSVRMLQVIEGVTNKWVIPWYPYFLIGITAPRLSIEWKRFGVTCYPRGNSRSRYAFNLSGLQLEGHINLDVLPENVVTVDISHNNLHSILFTGNGDGTFNLKDLYLQNNDNLLIDLSTIDLSSPWCCLYRTNRLTVSSNQINESIDDIEKFMRLSPGMKSITICDRMTSRQRKIKINRCESERNARRCSLKEISSTRPKTLQ